VSLGAYQTECQHSDCCPCTDILPVGDTPSDGLVCWVPAPPVSLPRLPSLSGASATIFPNTILLVYDRHYDDPTALAASPGLAWIDSCERGASRTYPFHLLTKAYPFQATFTSHKCWVAAVNLVLQAEAQETSEGVSFNAGSHRSATRIFKKRAALFQLLQSNTAATACQPSRCPKYHQ
jgi:hypothetical protein